jgi:hypothetical protein
LYLEALRTIDQRRAAQLLSARLFGPDAQVSARAARALVGIGAEEVFRALRQQREHALGQYPTLPNDLTDKIVTNFDDFMTRAKRAATAGLVLHCFLFGLTLLGAAVGVIITLASTNDFYRYFGIGLGSVCVLVLLLLVYRSPLHGVRRSLSRLVKTMMAFVTTLRQLNQAEALSKQVYAASGEANLEQVEAALQKAAASLSETLNQVDSEAEDRS